MVYAKMPDMRASEVETRQPGTCEGYRPAQGPICKAAMEVYQSVSFDRDQSLWWSVCPECGAEVEGETPEKVECSNNIEFWMTSCHITYHAVSLPPAI